MILPVGLSGLMLLIALIRIGSVQADFAEELDHELRSVSSLQADVTRAGALVERYSATGHEDLPVEFADLTVAIEENLEHLGHFDEPEEVELGHAAAGAWRSAQRDAQAVFAAAPGTAGARAAAALVELDTAGDELRALDEISREELHDAAEGSADTSRLVVAIALIIGAGATVTNIILVRRLLNSTFAPLRHLIQGVGRFGGADLSHRIEPIGDREFQEVGESFNAMADRLQQTFESLEHQAFHDALTELPNRDGLLRHLQTGGSPERAIVLFDIDDFKAVNDGMGHGAGDEALTLIARRLASCAEPSEFLARLGGDEFVVVLDACDPAHVAERAQEIADEISRPARIAGRTVVLQVSGGIAPAPRHEDPVNILRTADVALYVAKGEGKRCVRRFHQEMLRDVEGRLQLATDLRPALDRGEISVHYQPTVVTGSQQVHGVEALMRWHHPERGVVPPTTFIPVAEETGQILALGRYVLETACQQARAWQQLPGLGELIVNVNVSACQLQTPDIIADVARALDLSGLSPSSLTLEVTESVMANPEAVERVHQLRTLGVRIALDDFGTGYSSMSYLQRLPIDVLKIDRSFIEDIDSRADRAVLAGAIVRLGRSLGLVTVAEGVETPGHARALASVGCDLLQGYLFARPQPPAEAEKLLLGMAGRGPAQEGAPTERCVQVVVGPLERTAAREWLNHAQWALDELETGRLLPGRVPTAVVTLMRSYVDRWSIAAMDEGPFVWASDEDPQVLGLVMSRWRLVSDALVSAPADVRPSLSAEAAAFSRALAHSLLGSIAIHDHEAIHAAALARHWPNQVAVPSEADRSPSTSHKAADGASQPVRPLGLR